MSYRLYIDEVGNHDLPSARNPIHRYLSLTGVILDLDYAAQTAHLEMEDLKSHYFGSHPDDPIVFHRKQLVNRQRPFQVLQDPAVNAEFNRDILALLERWEYTVITVTIDKLQVLEQYAVWHYHPYHYCLKVLMERYVRRLRKLGACGDVLAESRGPKEDEQLKAAFSRVYDNGTEYLGGAQIQAQITSRQLKLSKKDRNVCGLQIADLVAHPSFRAMLAIRNREAPPENFGSQIARILAASKYDRSPSGKIDGWGRKWLP